MKSCLFLYPGRSFSCVAPPLRSLSLSLNVSAYRIDHTARKRETFATYSKLIVRAHNVQCQTLSYLSTCFGRDAPTLRKAKIAELKREHGHSKPALSQVKVVRDNNANGLSLLADPEVLRSKLQFASEEQAALNMLVCVCLCVCLCVCAPG